jgi:hypothetical protein
MPRTLEPLRWTIERAAMEFGLDRKTLSKRIVASSITPGDDGHFSTSEICAAVYSDSKAAKTALDVSHRENYELKNGELARKFADKELFQKLSDDMVLVLRQKISDDSRIPEAAKIEILKDIQNIDVDEVVKTNSSADDSDLENEP